MNTYGWLLLGQTLLALLALGMCGGWALWPFRRADRPFLWLVAPLTGLLTLGGTLALFYFFVGLPFRWCLWIGLTLNALGTAACLVRGGAARLPLRERTAAVVVVLATAYWGTVSCNKASIDAREPTLASVDGSDMYGYALVGDWLRAHPASEGPNPAVLLDRLAYNNLRVECSRPATFLLMAAAGEARGTSALFSYDWAAGVILAASLAGFAGAFAGNSLLLALLAVGVAVSSWLTDLRTGYMGKSVAYPAGVVLTSLFLTALAEPTRWRWGFVAVISGALAWTLNPMFPAVMFALLLGGYALALIALFVRTRWDERPDGFWAAVARPLVVALTLAAVASVPMFVIYRLAFGAFPPPPPPTDWTWVIPVSLDLEMQTLRPITPRTLTRLLDGCAALLIVALLGAVWRRQRGAAALLGCAAFVPFAWAIGEFRLFTFHGLIYPLTLAGAAALADARARRLPVVTDGIERVQPFWRTAARVGLVAVLVVGMIGLRVPQIRASAARYLYSPQLYKVVHRSSEVDALRDQIGSAGVDVALAHYADNCMAWAELAQRGVPVRFRSPAWEVSVGPYANSDSGYDLFAPKARFTLLERNAWAAPGTERWAGKRLKLVEDQGGVAVVSVTRAQAITWDGEWKPGAWLGSAPTTFLINNGTGQPLAVRLLGDTSAGPAHPDRDRRTLRYRLGDQTGTLTLPKENKAAIPLVLAPGLNRVELSVEEPPDPPTKPGYPVLLLDFRNWRFEPG